MKIIYSTILFIIIAQIGFAQTNVSFDLSNDTVKVNGSATDAITIGLTITKGKPLKFEVKNPPPAGFKFTLIVAGTPRLILTQSDFSGNVIETDTSLNYKNISLATAFSVKITSPNSSTITKGFKMIAPDEAGSSSPSQVAPPSQTTTTLQATPSSPGPPISPTTTPPQIPTVTRTTIAYYDAISLKDYTKLIPDSVFTMLGAYNDGLATPTTVMEMIDNNPFFPSAFKTGWKAAIMQKAKADAAAKAKADSTAKAEGKKTPLAAQGILQVVSSAVSSVGGLDVTNIANGVADLLIDRGQQELTIAFFKRFQNFVNDPKHLEFKVLFPKTVDNLSTFPAYNYTSWLPALRTGFYDDLQHVPDNLDDLLNLPDVKTALDKLPEITVAIRTISVAYKIKTAKLSLAAALDEFANFPEIIDDEGGIGFKNFANSMKLIAIFSDALRNTDRSALDAVNWIGIKQISDMVKDPDTFDIFLGLVYEQIANKPIRFYHYTTATTKDLVAVNFSTTMAGLQAPLVKFQTILSNFVSIANGVDSIKNDIKDKKIAGTAITNDDYFNYLNSALNVIEYGANIGTQFDASLKSVNDYVALAKKADEVYRDIYKEQYPQAILNIVYVLNKVVGDNNKTTLKAAGENDNAILKTADENSKTILKAADDITLYGLFMANIITAKTPDDVKAALNNAILPVGSYTIKQNSYYNVSVNGYVGYAFDFNKPFFSKPYAQGIYAPIGFSFSGDLKPCPKVNIPITLFVSAFDLGSVVSYRLQNVMASGTNANNGTTTTGTINTSSMDQHIKLASIFSPGTELLFEWRGLPLAFGVGWRRTPTLFYSSGSTYSIVGAKNVFTATILVDIPFFTLHNNPRNQK